MSAAGVTPMTRPEDPRRSFPTRVPGSVRRVMHLDYDWVDAIDVVVRGAARDETSLPDGSVRVDDETTMHVVTAAGLITEFALDGAPFDPAAFVGHPLRQGFRALSRSHFTPDGSNVGLLLDDISGAMVAASYVTALRMSTEPLDADEAAAMVAAAPPPPEVSPVDAADALQRGQADLCSGWRSDGTMMVMIRAGEPMRFHPIPAVALLPDGSDGWPSAPIPSPGLRRHRRIDVLPGPDAWHVDAWFRDTYCAPDGTLGSLHEYTVEATVDPATHTLLDVRAIPHALPWRECPAAADAVGKLAGHRVEDLRATVQRTLLGIESCTHLTNELRELADLPAMVARSRA
ncbi:MAG TPA: DUF2889 domain-containing protein [Acidimicrobiia bacterium]|nr:DUF2889 domain-containing protein [Acidimicrobiia bacterium]